MTIWPYFFKNVFLNNSSSEHPVHITIIILNAAPFAIDSFLPFTSLICVQKKCKGDCHPFHYAILNILSLSPETVIIKYWLPAEAYHYHFFQGSSLKEKMKENLYLLHDWLNHLFCEEMN